MLMQLARKQLDAADCPAPDEDEGRDEYLDRCVDEVSGDNPDADEDGVLSACEIAWDERCAPSVVHKTTVSKGDGMEFILSDATVDRYDDVIEPDGWKLS